jgi:hypothetical protein
MKTKPQIHRKGAKKTASLQRAKSKPPVSMIPRQYLRTSISFFGYEELLPEAEARAKSLRLTMPNYIRWLIIQDVARADNADDSNPCVEIPLPPEEVAALQKIARLIRCPEKRTVAAASLMVLKTALAHWDKTLPLQLADQRYAAAEGFTNHLLFQSKTIVKKFKLQALAPVLNNT